MEREIGGKGNEIKSGLKSGIISSVIPHLGCIVFIVMTLLGVSVGSVFLKKLILNSWSFPILVFISFFIAGISTFFYLKSNCCKNKIKYVATLLISVLVVNALVFYVVFPWAANLNGRMSGNSSVVLAEMDLKVEIPCSGHASLIIDELKKGGASEVVYNTPDEFRVRYDGSKVTKENLISLAILKEFKAVEIYQSK